MVPKVDFIYQDLSQRDQVKAFNINAKAFLKPSGFGIFMVKARSIDITRKPEQVFEEVISNLRFNNFKVHEKFRLEPYTKDHLAIIIQAR